MKKYFNVYHIYEIFNGSNISRQQKYIGLVEATDEEMAEFIKHWNKPRVYFNIGDRLYEHMVVALPVEKKDINKLEPYPPETREWPDLPEGMDFNMSYNAKTGKWNDESK